MTPKSEHSRDSPSFSLETNNTGVCRREPHDLMLMAKNFAILSQIIDRDPTRRARVDEIKRQIHIILRDDAPMHDDHGHASGRMKAF